MSGIMTAIAGNAQNIIYVSGLWVSELNTAQQSPITASVSTNGEVTIVRNLIGYYQAPATGTINLSIQTTAGTSGGFTTSASTQGRLWFGNNAFDGNNNTASISASGSQTVSANFNMTQGVYYPVRIRWNGSYSGSGFNSAFGSITFSSQSSTNVSGRIFYNQLTNGF